MAKAKKPRGTRISKKPLPPSKGPKPTPTDAYFFTEKCPTCDGCGRIPPRALLKGWYIDYHYQDGHEQCGPYTQEEAVRLMQDEHRGCIPTLIGPDGRIYTV